MRIVPETTINLYKGVTIDNGEQIVFTSLANQAAYFRSKLLRSNVNCTVVKTKSGTLRLEVPGSLVSQCNYLSFINPHFDNKTIYCKILDYNYINNECVEISYIIDPWQTWCFDVEIEDSLIGREHISQKDQETLEGGDCYTLEIPELMTPEPLAFGDSIEARIGKMYDAEFEDVDEKTDGNMGHSIIYGESRDDEEYMYFDCIFVSPVNFEDFDENLMYNLAFYQEYLDDRDYRPPTPSPETLDEYGNPKNAKGDTSNFYTWLRMKASEDSYDHDRYKLISPSTRMKELLEKITSEHESESTYAIYSNADQMWRYKFGMDSEDTMEDNSNMTMPYDIYCVPRMWGYAKEIVDTYTLMGAVSSILGMFSIPRDMLEHYFTDIGVHLHEIATSLKRMNNGNMPQIESHKLLRFPYCYFTFEDQDGNQKEYHYEDMDYAGIDPTRETVRVVTALDMNTQPCLIASPYGGIMRYTDNDVLRSHNIKDSMVVDAFPQMPYATDQYLAMVAASAQSLIGRNDSMFQYGQSLQQMKIGNMQDEANLTMLGNIFGLVGDVVGVTSGALATGQAASTPGKILKNPTGNYLGIGSNIIGFGESAASRTQAIVAAQNRVFEAQSELDAQKKFIGEAYGGLGSESSSFAGHFLATRPAYAANVYHAGSRCGILHYLKRFDPIDIKVRYHQPTNAILKKYDEYFKMFGYTSGRCGIPRVINYMKGVSNASELPHWVTINGRETTYIQTSSLKIVHSMQPVADAIRAMFDSGVRFIKGR